MVFERLGGIQLAATAHDISWSLALDLAEKGNAEFVKGNEPWPK
jgi:hypothetical protein